MEQTYHYHLAAHWTRGREGVLECEAAGAGLTFSAPPEFGGEPGAWTPEHLLLGAVASCFVTTFRVMAEYSRLEVRGFSVRAEGAIEKGAGGYRFTVIKLRPNLTLAREEDRERALRLAAKAEQACIISRSLTAKVELELDVDVATAEFAAR